MKTLSKIIVAVAALTLPVIAPARAMPQAAIQAAGTAQPEHKLTREEVQARLGELRRNIEILIGRTGDLSQILPATYNDLQSQKDKIALTLAGERVREKIIQEKIEQLTRQAQDQISGDATLGQLQKIADGKQQEAARLANSVKIGAAPASESEAAINLAAEAVVRVQERREAIAAAVGGGIVPSLTKELISVSLDIAQHEAVLEELQRHLMQAEKARDLYEQYVGLSQMTFPAQ